MSKNPFSFRTSSRLLSHINWTKETHFEKIVSNQNFSPKITKLEFSVISSNILIFANTCAANTDTSFYVLGHMLASMMSTVWFFPRMHKLAWSFFAPLQVRRPISQVSHMNWHKRSTSAVLSLNHSNIHLNPSFSLSCAKVIGHGDTSKPKRGSFPFENVLGIVFIKCTGSCLVAPIDQWNSQSPAHQWQHLLSEHDKTSPSPTPSRLERFPVHNQQRHLWKKSHHYCTLSDL